MFLSGQIDEVLASYHDRMASEKKLMQSLSLEEGMQRRDDFLLPVGLDAARFLNMLSKSSKAQVILEIGTSYGYSTIWLAEAARQTGGKVISLEQDKRKAAFARAMLEEAGLADVVDFKIGDALESLRQLTVSPDFVLVDLWKEFYVPCFDLFYPKLETGAYVVADNMLFPVSHHADATAYRKAVRETQAFDSVLLPIGSGLEVSFLREE